MTPAPTAARPHLPTAGLVLLIAAAADSAAATEAIEAPALTTGADAAAAPVPTLVVGSYGRVATGSNLEGQNGERVQLVDHPPRLLEGTYAELDVGTVYAVPQSSATLTSQLTLALGERLFHFSGEFAADLAIRNLYVEAADLIAPGLSLWAGSRMLRGDAIYLFDFWPLDEQNTVGGGAGYTFGRTRLGLHLGVNRLADRYQTQVIRVPDPVIGSRAVLFLDRQRSVLTARAAHRLALASGLTLCPVVYAEAHHLAAGSYQTADHRVEALPDDSGWLMGTEVTVGGVAPTSHLSAFLRYARGLAAYGELGVPFGLGTDKRARRAKELSAGLDGNLELVSRLGVMAAAHGRYFVDADPNVYDRDDVFEATAAVRPAFSIGDHFQLAGEANVQYQRPNGLSPETHRQEKPLAFQVGLMPTLALERGTSSRPVLRLIYAATFLNGAARLTYAPEVHQRSERVQHYIGVNVEWWWNSSRYPGSNA
ncbi:MAG: carbohydrate porin [Deltaproteobacteria bacterium]|nr:carbohydrate porin [Deltaproteobacteria bacterium]